MSVAQKLTLAMVSMVCVILTVFGYTRIQRQYALFETDMQRDHRTLGRTMAHEITRIWNSEGEQAALQFIAKTNNRYSHIQIRWAPRVRQKEKSWVAREERPYGNVHTLIPIVVNGSPKGMLEMIESLDEEESYVDTFVVRIAWAAFSMILASALIAAVFGNVFIGRPMGRLVRMAKRIGSGDFTKSEHWWWKDEIGQLAGEMNSMCDQLRDSRKALTENIDRLQTTEQTLSRSLTLLESILADAPIGRAYADSDLRYVWVNQALAKIHEKPIEYHLGKTVREVVPSVPVDFESKMKLVLEFGKPMLQVPFKLAGKRNYECVLYPVRDEMKTIQGIGMAVSDVTDRKKSEGAKKRFLEYVVSTQESERKRIARELHDGVSQSLTALAMETQALQASAASTSDRESLKGLHTRITDVMDEIGRMVHGLHPILLDDLGLSQAIHRLRNDFHGKFGMQIDLQLLGFESEPRLPSGVEVAIYRIVQEGLSNVARHAHATSTNIVIERRKDLIQTIIEDNGSGISEQPENEQGIGLESIRERASLLNGTLNIESQSGKGTTLYVRIPLEVA
jgi:signal transduction histidine kinase